MKCSMHYAGTLVVNSRLLSSRVDDRKAARRARRTQKTKKRRLRKLKQTLKFLGIEEDVAKSIVSFSRRRGYSWKRDEIALEGEQTEKEYFDFSISREEFFSALKKEIERILPEDRQREVFDRCRNVLDREIRPSRFMNRNPSKCWWEGCNRNLPSARNAVELRLRQSLFIKFLPLIDLLHEDKTKHDEFIDSLNAFIAIFRELSDRFRKTQLLENEEMRMNETKTLREEYRKKKADFKKYLLSVAKSLGKEHLDNIRTNFNAYYGKEIDNVVKKVQSGRVSFCREHSDAYVQHMLEHKEIPYRQTISDRQIISKQKQILFNKIWRFTEARLLPLAEGKIDAITVERSAFDLLAIPFSDKTTLSEKKTDALYWYGPRYGYKSRVEMLYNEFDGHCTYCGGKFNTDELNEVEHILPRSRFNFDNYFNLTLSCRDCNRKKGDRTAYESGLTIHETAYNAYSDYVKKRGKFRHSYHNLKKGILNLMRRKDSDAETVLSIIGQNLLEIAYTMRGPRPLARYLARKLNERSQNNPAIKYVAGRHTAVYRQLLFPDFDKLTDKLLEEKEDSVNHALDACILAFWMPAVTELERGRYAYRDVTYWADRVRSLASKTDNTGLPAFTPPQAIQNFETQSNIAPSFYTVDLMSTAWNKKDAATIKQNPYGMTNEGMPIKKKSGVTVLQEILERKDREKLTNYINMMSHRVLKGFLLKAINTASDENIHITAAQGLVEWLRKSVEGSLRNNRFSPHPSSQARSRHLEDFIHADISEVMNTPEKYIPPNISIRMLDLGVRGSLNVRRMDRKTGQIIHHYMCHPAVKMKIVAYKSLDSTVNKSRPFVFDVRQNWQVLRENGEKVVPEGHVLNGRVLSDGKKEKDFLRDWDDELKRYLREQYSEWHFLRQGCYVEYGDGRGRFIRNFKKTTGYKNEMLKEIARVYTSPYKWLQKS
jgi:5-methylcytosine-specific restriction endonuclease McrA